MNPSPDDLRPGLRPPQFGLATMMVTMAVLGVCFAMVTYFGAYAATIFVLFGLMVLAHVAGNALGMRLRQNGDTPVDDLGEAVTQRARSGRPVAVDYAPATQLRDRSSLGLPVIVATVAGFVLAAAAGALLLPMVLSRAPTLTALIAGAIACGVLGAIGTFISFSFIQVAGSAMWQATSEPPLKDPKAHGQP